MLWDHFVMHGDASLFQAAVGILKHIEAKLINGDCFSFHTVFPLITRKGLITECLSLG
jgi:hypothetical protein